MPTRPRVRLAGPRRRGDRRVARLPHVLPAGARGTRTTSVALEKEQSAVLADTIQRLLDELMEEPDNRYSVPADVPAELVDDDPPGPPGRGGVPHGRDAPRVGPSDGAGHRRGVPARGRRRPRPRGGRAGARGVAPRQDARGDGTCVRAAHPCRRERGRPCARGAAGRSTPTGTCARCPTRRDDPARRRRRAVRSRPCRHPPDAALTEMPLDVVGRIRPRRTRRSSPAWATSRSCTSRWQGRSRCGTSRTARSRVARSPRTSCRRRSAGVVPRTWLRDGPLGPGMVQLWQDVDSTQSPVDVVPTDEVPRDGVRTVLEGVDEEDRPVSVVHEDSPTLRRMAVLDAVVNNADRKGGHVRCRWRTGGAPASTTASRSTSSPSSARCSGAGSASRSPTTSSPGSSACVRASTVTSPTVCASSSRPTRWPPSRSAATGCCARHGSRTGGRHARRAVAAVLTSWASRAGRG